MFVRLDGIPEPPEGYVPPLGSSRMTWANIYKNKGRIDYCVQQFSVSFVEAWEKLRMGSAAGSPRSLYNSDGVQFVTVVSWAFTWI
jgi:hypothetical protein